MKNENIVSLKKITALTIHIIAHHKISVGQCTPAAIRESPIVIAKIQSIIETHNRVLFFSLIATKVEAIAIAKLIAA